MIFYKSLQIICSGLLFLAFATCCSSKQGNKGMITTTEDSVINSNVGTVIPAGVPQCIVELIAKYRNEPKENPPRKIFQYNYRGKKVYYVTAPCCDFFTDLLDENCNVIAHPDGGITGRGDGKAPDFMKEKTNEKLIWEDKR